MEHKIAKREINCRQQQQQKTEQNADRKCFVCNELTFHVRSLSHNHDRKINENDVQF